MVGSEGVCIFSPLVTGEEWAVIPEEIAKKIESFFTEKVEELITSKALLETNRYNAEQSLTQAREELERVSEENEGLKTRFEIATSTITTLEEQVSTLNTEFSKLQTTSRKLEEEAAEHRHQRNLAVDERDEHLNMLQRRNAEIERMQADMKSLMEQLETAINTKCEALAQADSVESMKITLEYKEKRIEQERSLLKSQVESLSQELHLKTEELLNIRRDNTSKCIQLETKLIEKTQELEVSIEQVKSLTEFNNNLTIRIEELSQNLANQRDTEGKINESYLQEIDANTKLANAYQQMYEESKKYAEGLKEALDETQELLKNATNKYGELETKHKESELAHEEIINKKNEYIALLKSELETANELLENSKQFKLQKDMEEISPTAATTTNILKTGMTFTELYSKYVSMSDKILTLQEENSRLNNYISNIVKEIEEKGPFIKKLKDDYARLVDCNEELKLNNDSLLMEIQQLRENNTECRRLESATARENSRLQKDIADLSRQVCHLLQEVEQSRMGSSTASPEMDFNDSLSSADIITKRLVTFNDILDLQQNNKKLLSLVRELSEKQEEAESFDPAAISNLRSKLDNMREQQQDLLEEKEKQNKMMETLKNQRDMYKNLYSQAVKGSGEDVSFNMQESVDSNKTTKDSMSDSHHSDEKNTRELESQIENLKKQMEQLKTEKDSYKEEKQANEKIVDDQMKTLRKENKDLTTLNCKLVAQSEVSEEKFKVLKNNMEVLKKQVTALEKQNKIFSDTILKHEQTLNYLRDDAMQAHSKLSKAEVMLANLEKENALLKDSEARTRKEYESLKQQMHSQHLIHSNIELIKATLERTDSEGKLRLEARLDEAHRECSALRRRLQEEQDRFRQLTDHLQTQTQNALKRCDEEKAEADKLRADLGEIREELASKNGQIDELTKKIKLSILAIPESHGEGKKIRHLEELLDNAQAEIETLKARVKTAKEASDQYFNIAENAEKQMKVLTDQQESLNAELEKHKATIRELQERCSELEGELSIQMDDQDMASVSNMSRHTQLQEELNVRSLDLKTSREQLESCRTECKSLIENLKAVENKYAREVMLHSADLQALTEMKESLNLAKNELNDVKQERDNILNELDVSKASWKTQEEYLLKHKSELETRLKDLDAQNSLLLSQMETLNSQFAILQTQVTSENFNHSMNDSTASVNRSFTEDEVKSSEQLLKIIKYLRQEKDVAVSKSEILEAEHLRVKSKLDLVTKQLEEMKQVVENERQKSEVSVVTAAKHAEVLRKVETLNAITDSNRALRQERDNLVIQVNNLRARIEKLEADLSPLQEKNIELNTKAEAMQTENISLRAECNRWRQRANILIEKSNRTSPEDWKKLQNERDNLSKQLTIEKSNIVKLNDEINTLKQDKSKLEDQLKNVRSQNYSQAEELLKLKEEVGLLRTQINNMNSTLEQIQEQNKKLLDENKLIQEDNTNKESVINELKNNLTQVRKIAKKYKIQFEDKTKEMETFKQQQDEQKQTMQNETSQREEQLKTEHQQLEERMGQMEQRNKEVIDQLNQQVSEITEENENQKREIERVKQSSLEKEERFKQLFKNAKDRIVTLTEHNKELKEELKNQDRPGKSGDSSNGEMLAKIEALLKEKDEMIAEHLQEKEKLNSEIDVLSQKVTQLQRQLGLQQGSKPSTSSGTTEKSTTEPPTANIKPMAGHSTNTQTQSVPIQPWRNAGETPLASIRPMSAQLRTVAVLPTSQSPSAVMVPPQQQVHTTGSSNSIEALSSSPTSSHTDYVPATSSASSAMLGPRQVAVPPSQSSQDTEDEDNSVQVHTAPQQQAVALVLPRVEPPTGSSSSSSGPTQEQGTSSSSNTVTTSQAGHKRQRDSDTEACQADDQAKVSQQSKRTRLQQTGTVSDSVLEVEYQVPTSSQRDHDDDNVIVLESDEDGGPDEGEGADDEPDDPDTEGYDIEGMEQDNYEEADCQEEEEEEGGNEVEVIDDSSEVPNQSEESAAEGHSPEENTEQPQSEAISSGTDGSSSGITISQASPSVPQPTMSMFSRSGRPVAPLARPQQSHLLLPHVEEGGDDSIVPSTPTLFVPRRSDGFGEAVSSPHVPSGRFTFNDSAPPSTSGSVEVVPEQTLEVMNMDENSTGRSVPSTPLQSSPQEAVPVTEENESGQSGQPDDIPAITVSGTEDDAEQVADGGSGDMGPPVIAGTSSEGAQSEDQGEDMMEGDDEVSSEGEKPPAAEEGEEEGREAEASPSTNGRSRNLRGVGVARRQARNISSRGFVRSGPTPIVWGEHRQQNLNSQQRPQGHSNFNRLARRSRGRSPFRRF